MFGGKLMDSFKDMIAEKFGTTDIIKANSEAEARELKETKEYAKDLENNISEMRRLNLKCVETNEMTAQLVQGAIEKIEELRTNPQQDIKDYTEDLNALSESLKAMEGDIESCVKSLETSIQDSFKAQEEVIHKENVRVYRNVQASIVEELKQQSEALAIQHKSIEKKLKGIKPIAIIALVFNGITTVAIVAAIVLYLLGVISF